jgi:hypothetical protein
MCFVKTKKREFIEKKLAENRYFCRQREKKTKNKNEIFASRPPTWLLLVHTFTIVLRLFFCAHKPPFCAQFFISLITHATYYYCKERRR